MSLEVKPLSAHINKDTDTIGKMVMITGSRTHTLSALSARRNIPLTKARAQTQHGLRL